MVILWMWQAGSVLVNRWQTQRRRPERCIQPDGKTLASGSLDKTVILWDVDLSSWIAKAKHIANRALTPDERRRYLGTE